MRGIKSSELSLIWIMIQYKLISLFLLNKNFNHMKPETKL